MTRLYFNEVAPRDGLQSEPRFVPTDDKVALVPNQRGAERAMASRADELNLVLSVSETHNLANLRMSRARSFAAPSDVIRLVDGRTPINALLLLLLPDGRRRA
jgi:hydroxymethylglutaryl-CoA lyase